MNLRNLGKKSRIKMEHRTVSSIFIDESGSRNSSGGFFVIGFVKVRNHGRLARDIREIRNRHKFFSEIKFSAIRNMDLPFYFEVAECLAAADVRVGGSVYDATTGFEADLESWEQQGRMARRLVLGNVNRGEQLNVFLDLVQTPMGISVAEYLKREVNRKLAGQVILESYDVDSRATDLVQLADLVAGSIRYERAEGGPRPGKRDPAKRKVSERLRRALELDSFDDVRAGKVNILTMGDLVDAEKIPGLG